VRENTGKHGCRNKIGKFVLNKAVHKITNGDLQSLLNLLRNRDNEMAN
jgi:hypothetical protein